MIIVNCKLTDPMKKYMKNVTKTIRSQTNNISLTQGMQNQSLFFLFE